MTQILKALSGAGIRSFPEVRAFCEAPPYHVRVSERGGLYALRYRRGESDFRSPVVRQARGIVLEKDTNRIVSWAFDKFYEYGEDGPSYRNRPNLRKSVHDPRLRFERKYDGVLIKVVKLSDGEVLVSTNGKIDAADAPLLDPEAAYGHSDPDGDLAKLAGAVDGAGGSSSSRAALPRRSLRQVFAEVGGLDLPYEEGHCYVFELLHPDVPTVAPASEPALVHLTTRSLAEGFKELPAEQRWGAGAALPPEVMNFRSFGACRDAAFVLPWDDEGFVVADSIGNRTKVKSEAYKAMQRLLVGDSPSEDEDALAVALTLHSAKAPLPAGPAQLVTQWRVRLDSLVEACTARAAAARDLAERSGRSMRARHAAIERGLGGRLPRSVRTVIAAACADWMAKSGGEANSDAGWHGGDVILEADYVSQPVAILHTLRRSRLGLHELADALRAA
uniref:T4 RNA ligase 1-like N-terminal domain-containing protein n=1 Tax=Alexandrium catenella TaxID=2925 RepID=A0A7S1QEI5_ALECA